MYNFLSVVILLFLTGCYSITQYPEQQHTFTKSTISHTEVKVTWHKSVDDMPKYCTRLPQDIVYGCAIVFRNDEKSFCLIHAIEPKDFNDTVKLAILGHEFWHCLGARHK